MRFQNLSTSAIPALEEGRFNILGELAMLKERMLFDHYIRINDGTIPKKVKKYVQKK